MGNVPVVGVGVAVTSLVKVPGFRLFASLVLLNFSFHLQPRGRGGVNLEGLQSRLSSC